MADQQFSVEIPVSIKDNSGPGARAVQSNLSNLERMAQKTSQTKVGLMARVQDDASRVLKSLESLAAKLARTTISIGVRVLDYATAPLRSILSLATSTIGLLGIGAGGYGLFQGLVNAPLQMADNFRATTLAFQQLMGAAQGAAYVKSLQNWAISTPFPQQQVLGFGRQLLGAGFNQSQSLRWLQTIGDASTVFNLGTQGFSTINTAVSRMRSTGMLDAGAIEMINDTGVPLWQILQQLTGMGPLALKTRVGSGTMSADQYLPMIEQALDQRYGGSMGKLMNESIGGLASQLKDLFNVNVLQSWGTGLSDVIIPGMKRLNDWFGANTSTVEKWRAALQDAGHTVATTVLGAVDGLMGKLTTLVNSKEWSNATTLGQKISLAWDTVIAKPFDAWWKTSGKAWATTAAGNIGTGLGSALHDTLITLLGADSGPMASAGQTAGGAFARGFAKGFQGSDVLNAALKVVGNAQPKALGGGSDSFIGTTAFDLGLGWLGLKALGIPIGVGKGIFGAGKGLFGLGRGIAGLFGGGAEAAAGSGVLTGTMEAGGVDLLGELGAGAAGAAGAEAGAGLLGSLVAPEVVLPILGLVALLPTISKLLGGSGNGNAADLPTDFAGLDGQTKRLITDFGLLADELEGIRRGGGGPPSGQYIGGGSSPLGLAGGDSGGRRQNPYRDFPSITQPSTMPSWGGTSTYSKTFGTSGLPAPGDIEGWRKVLAQQAGPLGQDPNFVNTLLAGAYAESGLDPNRIQKGGGGRGFFQFDLGGMGAGLSPSQLFSEPYQAAQIIPLYAQAYLRGKAMGLTGAALASYAAAMAERPYDYTNPNSVARQNYASAYNTVVGSGSNQGYAGGGTITEPILGVGVRTGQSYTFGENGIETVTPGGRGAGGPLIGNVSVVVNSSATNVAQLAEEIADPVANAIARKLEMKNANTPTRRV